MGEIAADEAADDAPDACTVSETPEVPLAETTELEETGWTLASTAPPML